MLSIVLFKSADSISQKIKNQLHVLFRVSFWEPCSFYVLEWSFQSWHGRYWGIFLHENLSRRTEWGWEQGKKTMALKEPATCWRCVLLFKQKSCCCWNNKQQQFSVGEFWLSNKHQCLMTTRQRQRKRMGTCTVFYIIVVFFSFKKRIWLHFKRFLGLAIILADIFVRENVYKN